MPWITLTLDHIKSRLSEAEITCYDEVGRLEDGEVTSRITGPSGVIFQVTQLIRSKVVSCHKNKLGPRGTIPEECIHAAVSIARHNITSTPGGDDGERDRDEEYRDAMSFLRDVSRCAISIKSPDGEIGGRGSGCFGGDLKHNF